MKAEEFRQASLETFGQSCKRKEGDLDDKPCSQVTYGKGPEY